MTRFLKLNDGRQLCYDDLGQPGGKVVFYFHGVPSSRLDWRVWGNEAALHSLGVRLIAIDRPGTGQSSFQPGRRLSDWPADVTALADALGLERISVLGYSGGGPYAAACAARIPERLKAAGMVSSLAPFEHQELVDGINPDNVRFLRLAIQNPLIFRFIDWQMGLLARFAPQSYLKRALQTFGPSDREVFSRPEVHSALFAAGGSPRGEQWDTRLLLSAWDFRLEDISMPVSLWQGGQDRNASPAMGRHLAQAIPHSRLNFMEDEGHISLIVRHYPEILSTLIAD